MSIIIAYFYERASGHKAYDLLLTHARLDWDESETDLSHLVSGPGVVGGKIDGSTQPAAEAFWEENWDDDDIEDDFSKQLRYALVERTHYTNCNAHVSFFCCVREELAKVGSTTDTPMSG